MTASCPYCSATHAEGAFLCPTTQQRLTGILTAGTVIDGKYRILGVLGTGGMAAVYRAEHLKIGRTVALKLLLPEFVADPDLVARVEREARASGGIDHPNVAAVTDLGKSPEYGPYLAMELLRGEDLAATLHHNGGELPANESVAIVRQVLSALVVAHARGVVHRDLKPENIFMVPTADGGTLAKVLDFGISKVASEQGAVSSLTRTGTVMGTPQFMAPEQAVGAKNQDGRVDLYAVGVLLYELLTGAHPHEADNFNLLIDKILNHPPVPITQHDGSIDPALAAIVMRALQKRPEDRYQTAREMLDALTAWGRASTPEAASSPEPAAPAPPGDTADLRRAPTSRAAPNTTPPSTALEGAYKLALDSARERSVSSPERPQKRGWKRLAVALTLVVVATGAAGLALRAQQPARWNAIVLRLGLSRWTTPEGMSSPQGTPASEPRGGPAPASHGTQPSVTPNEAGGPQGPGAEPQRPATRSTPPSRPAPRAVRRR